MSKSILAYLLPLASLIEAVSEPRQVTEQLLDAARRGGRPSLSSLFPDSDLARSCLEEARVLEPDGHFSHEAVDRLLELRVLLTIRSEERDDWEPVLTLPPFLRPMFDDERVLETPAVLRQLILDATDSLIIASPFLDAGFRPLISGITRLLEDGGRCLLLTRGLLDPGPSGRNRSPIKDLRARISGDESDRLRIVSWEGSGLGIHMKVLVVDEARAYVGSANLTYGGLGDHAEVGVLVSGPSVGNLATLMRTIADKIGKMRSWQAT